MDDPNWLLWARELQAIAQTGLTFADDRYDLERYQRLRDALAAESPGALAADFLFEKDKIFAYLNLDNEELKLYERYFERFAADKARVTKPQPCAACSQCDFKARCEDEWRKALKGGALQRLEARSQRESATDASRQIAVEVVRPVPAVDPSRRSMLGAVDLKRRLLDARIAQRNHRLRKMRPGLAHVLYRAQGQECDDPRRGISQGSAGDGRARQRDKQVNKPAPYDAND